MTQEQLKLILDEYYNIPALSSHLVKKLIENYSKYNNSIYFKQIMESDSYSRKDSIGALIDEAIVTDGESLRKATSNDYQNVLKKTGLKPKEIAILNSPLSPVEAYLNTYNDALVNNYNKAQERDDFQKIKEIETVIVEKVGDILERGKALLELENDKTKIDTEELELAKEIYNRLITHPIYNKLKFAEKQFVVQGVIEGQTAKGLLDFFLIDEVNKKIYNIDLKVTKDFVAYYTGFNIPVQMAWYEDLLRQNYPDYEIVSSLLVVEYFKNKRFFKISIDLVEIDNFDLLSAREGGIMKNESIWNKKTNKVRAYLTNDEIEARQKCGFLFEDLYHNDYIYGYKTILKWI